MKMFKKLFGFLSLLMALPAVAGDDMTIDWQIPSEPYAPISVEVGDTVTWNWSGFHNVQNYPSSSCDKTGLTMVGESSGASKTFVDADGSDEGMVHHFACSVGSHCGLGMQIMITVYTQGMMPSGEIGSDYLDPLEAPPTIYESEDPSPQNMDFDMDNNMFVAHSGWYQDKLIHYYKFRIFAPGDYPDTGTVGSAGVPLQNIYFVTDSGDFSGVMGMPIIEHHTADGVHYSDFMVVNFITAPDGYTADMYRSLGDFMGAGAEVTATDIVLNIPVVPTGATLQDPMDMTATAPIDPIPVWYYGAEVWTYLFEVSDQSAADYFAWTRPGDTSPTRNTLVTGYEIPVVASMASNGMVHAIPIWHVNQFDRGVTEGVNGGGPNPAGMRNVIDMDRMDPGYSPLWQILWATDMPINYMADEFSNAVDGTVNNGFKFFQTPMFVNCPDIGLVGTEINSAKKEEFMDYIDVTMSDMHYIMGSHSSLIMQGGVPVMLMADGVDIDDTVTNMMGGYEFALANSDIPEGTMYIQVMAKGTIIHSISIGDDGDAMLGGDYLDPLVAPPTVYELPDPSPQNMDFDKDNNMFVAHSGWYQDKLIHYYKFRMFTPGSYPAVGTGGASAVPLQKIYFVTTTGDFSGVMGMPIIEYHTANGVDYSDFMVVHFVNAPEGYVADMYKSIGDFMSMGATVVPTDMVLNIPVVPIDSTLQDTMDMSTTAPIQPVRVWYYGVEVWTYVFEVTHQAAADYFADTRDAGSSDGYAISVVPTMATASMVSAIPIWHVNQFSRGVTAGVNGGGPNPAGMRNVIDMDRPDAGYSPLWQVYWATEMPININADEFSNAVDGTSENGFEFFETPMFVNCPDIGMVGTEVNSDKKTEFMDYIDMSMDMNYVVGSHQSIIMTAGVAVKVMAGDVELASGATNMMGGYEFEIVSADIPEDTMEVTVETSEAIRTIEVMWESSGDGAFSVEVAWTIAMLLAMAALIV